MAKRRNTEAALRAQKDAKQKKLLFVLIPVFLLLVVWQGPKTLKAFQGSSSAAPPPPVSTTTTTPSPTPGTPAPTDNSTGLPDTDVLPDLLDGQLVSFSRFHGRDPFAVSGSATGSGGSSGPVASGATIEVNGTSETVPIAGAFPSDDPTFRLVSVSESSADIGLVSGSFSNGAQMISINVGETLVLVADDGARYAIKLVSVATS